MAKHGINGPQRSEIVAEVKDYLKTLAKEYVVYCADKTKEKAKNIMDSFYSDHNPRAYRRTDNLRGRSSSPYKHGSITTKIRIRDQRGTARSSVSIDSNKMDFYRGFKQDEGYIDVNPNLVLCLAWWSGKHGNKIVKNGRVLYVPEITRPVPIRELHSFYVSRNFREEALNHCYSVVKKNNYKYIKPKE